MTNRIRRTSIQTTVAVVLAGLVTGVAAGATAPGHAVVAVGAVQVGAAAVRPPASAVDPGQPLADQALREQVAASLAGARPSATSSDRPNSESVAMVGVEVITSFSTDVADRVLALGGVVTGGVPGAVVQAQVPATRVMQLAASAGVESIQAIRRLTRPPVAQPIRAEVGPGFGSAVGQNVAITNAGAWQAAGVDGSIKVGIVDYFDLGLWSPTEAGPVPDGAHRFCQDTSGSTDNVCSSSHNDGVNDGDGYEHGVAVAQIVKDMAPAAEIYIASVGTVSDLAAAIDFFAANGVRIMTRSLGAAFDGPGDGTGPLAAVVDYAANHGIVWFNSAGNDAVDGYARVVVPANLSATNNYVDFDPGPGVDTYLRISGDCIIFDGIRWDDWNKPASQRTDYEIEAWAPISNPDTAHGEQFNPSDLTFLGTSDNSQAGGAPPLELVDDAVCPVPNTFGFASGIIYIRIHRKANTFVGDQPDTLEVALGFGVIELGRGTSAFSAAKPVVDSRNASLIAVGAIDPASGTGFPDAIADYSSQGPTNDGRVKPDVSAPSCVASTLYPGCFNGTSAASPSAAGVAALLLDAGVALPGVPLASAVRHFVVDRPFAGGGAADGPDNKYGAGEVRLPAAPSPAAATSPAAYHPLTPARILDTRSTSPIGSPIGAQPQYGIIDVAVVGAGGVPSEATAVALNLTSTDNVFGGFIQAVPYLRSPLGASSTLNVQVGAIKPNFAIVPVGQDGKIAIYDVPGGNIIVDVLGYFSPTDPAPTAGRFVPLDPTRVLDTRGSGHLPNGEAVVVPAASGVPATDVAALVLNVTSTESIGPGFLRAQPTGIVPSTSTVNYTPGVNSANAVIVPVGSDGTVSVFTSNGSHIVVDVTGYITSSTAPSATTGRFVPLPPARAYDSRMLAGAPALNVTRSVPLSGAVPAGATGVSINLTAADEAGPGFLTAFPSGSVRPPTSSLNFLAAQPIANGALLKLSPSAALDVFANQASQVIVDINGYFT